ncbi:MAG TPA: hypothetical protein VMS78_08555 [Rhizomicrobium sp.]|nr:hypothetical protein [Rhizomicrobium sp.]
MTPSPSVMSPGEKAFFEVLAFIFGVGWMVCTWGNIRSDDMDSNVGFALVLLPLAVLCVWARVVNPDLAERLKQGRAARGQNTSEEEKSRGRKFVLITQSITFGLTLLATYVLRISGIAAPNFDVKMAMLDLYGIFLVALILAMASKKKPVS